MAVKRLDDAKFNANDEFYTSYNDIQEEVNHYVSQFKDKVVLCNADDPYESNFCRFFLKNFNYLQLKKLICTSYESSPVIGTQLSLFDDYEEPLKKGRGYVFQITQIPMEENGRGITDSDIDKILHKKGTVKRLKGDGDFRSEECLKFLKEADIVCTNPPFSLYRPYVALLMEYEKPFLIMGNMNSIKYKEIFPYIKDNKMWTGYGFNKTLEFRLPDSYKKWKRTDARGNKYGNVPAITWFTNLDVQKRHDKLILWKKYEEGNYYHFDNYDGIDVPKIQDIPIDYEGNMAVPITFLNDYNPEQFEILGIGDGDSAKLIGVQKNHRGRTDLAYTKETGEKKCPFARLVIRHKR